MRLFLSITNKCNMKCEYCYYNIGYLPMEQCKLPTLSELIDRLDCGKRMGVTSVSFTGGEPFTRADDLFKLINHADKNDMSCVVVTNGKYLWSSKEALPKDTINKVMCMAISLHIDTTTNIDVYFEKMQFVIRERLSFFKNRIRFNLTLTKYNARYLSKCIEFANRLGVDLNIQPVVVDKDCSQYSNLSLVSLSDEEKKDICSQITKWAEATNNKDYGQKFSDYIINGTIKNGHCLAGDNFFVIDECGRLFPCFYRSDADFGKVSLNSCNNQIANLKSFYCSDKKCGNEQCIVLTEFGQYL